VDYLKLPISYQTKELEEELAFAYGQRFSKLRLLLSVHQPYIYFIYSPNQWQEREKQRNHN